MSEVIEEVVETTEHQTGGVIPLSQFITDFGDSLLEAVVEQNPPVYDGKPDPRREAIMDGLLRDPYPPQREVVQAVTRLMVDAGEPAAVINAEMGTGKTIMAIAVAVAMHVEGYLRSIVISPPHLVYKWRREILETVPDAQVWILNGPETLAKLLQLRARLAQGMKHEGPEFFILGRVRMRMGFHWQPAYMVRKRHFLRRVDQDDPKSSTVPYTVKYVACSKCGAIVKDADGESIQAGSFSFDKRQACGDCHEPLWTLVYPKRRQKSQRERVSESLCKIPTIGPKTAQKLLSVFGEDVLEGMLADNVYEFINLMDDKGELIFSDRKAQRMERAMAKLEFSFGQGGYQPTEFIKRYLPQDYFGLMIVDEGHEYKNQGSAQGQAMGVLTSKVRKTLLLTGTLMGGYADDLFYLLWRILTKHMIEDGYRYNKAGNLGPAAMAFMRDHGILKDVFKETEAGSHRTSNAKRIVMRTSKAPGFGPKGITRYVLPYTAFLKLKNIGGNVLPSYDEHFSEIAMTAKQAVKYQALESALTTELKQALAKGDTTLLGVVLNVLLAWPDTCFREEVVKHPRTKALLTFVASVFDDTEVSPKEATLIRLCKSEKAKARRVLVYTTYTGKRDTMARLKSMLLAEGLTVAVLRSSVGTSRREDWIMDQVERDVDVLITNPELVKTGLDLLEFPTIVFMQTGYNVYTLMQASRRSWRIGQTQPVAVHYLGYEETAQIACLSLMASKIAVSQSTSGDMPDSGLDVLNPDGDSIEVALARQLLDR